MRLPRFAQLAALGAVVLAGASLAQEHFDYRVRDDMFRAFGGNEAAYKSAMGVIEEQLAVDPDHAEALVWRGVGRFIKAGQAFTVGDSVAGRALAGEGMTNLDRAIALAPKSVAVLIPRASVLLVAARNQRDPERVRDMAARAADNFETALALRQGAFAGLAQHNRGEYLSGLAESWSLAGDREKAEKYLQRILAELPSSPYAERAAAKIANWDDRRPLNCQTCH